MFGRLVGSGARDLVALHCWRLLPECPALPGTARPLFVAPETIGLQKHPCCLLSWSRGSSILPTHTHTRTHTDAHRHTGEDAAERWRPCQQLLPLGAHPSACARGASPSPCRVLSAGLNKQARKQGRKQARKRGGKKDRNSHRKQRATAYSRRTTRTSSSLRRRPRDWRRPSGASRGSTGPSGPTRRSTRRSFPRRGPRYDKAIDHDDIDDAIRRWRWQ